MNRFHVWRIALVAAMVCTGTLSTAQSRSTLEDQGYDYLNALDFVHAYEVFDKLHSKYPEELDYQFKLGICALNYAEKKERAIEIFKAIRDKKKTAESELYLAKAYHRNYKFDDALAILRPLNDQINTSKRKEDKDLLPDLQLTMKNCDNGIFLVQNKTDANVVNIGPPVNSRELEAVPIITADESMMIMTYVGKASIGGKQNAEMKSDPNGNYLSDIYMSVRDSTGRSWAKPKPVLTLNTRGNDAAIAMAPDGSQLFTFLSSNENEGDIMVSLFDGKNFSPPTPLNANVNSPEYWEGSCSISADGKFLYFSSERPGGLGGRDIWVSEFVDGDWGPAQNLGDKVNTDLDEDAPFIHPDGVTLFFSSKGHTSIGGYDIMFSAKGPDGWGTPASMGVPVNTTEDDSYYVINSRGDKGYFSSTRTGAGGFGSHDIYMVTPGVIGAKPIVAMLKGVIYGDDKPIEAKIEVVKATGGENVGNYGSAKENGKYLLTFAPGQIYKIKVSASGFNDLEEELDLSHLDRFMEQKKDFYIYSTTQVAKENEKKNEPIALKEPEPEPLPVAKTEEQLKAEEEAAKEAATGEPISQTLTKEVPAGKEAAEAEFKKESSEVKSETAKKEAVAKAEEAKKGAVAKVEPAKKPKRTAKEEPEEEFVPPANELVALEKAPCAGELPDLGSIKGKSLNDPLVYKRLLQIAGNYCADNVVFRVQVGAYKHPENFKPKRIESLGKVESSGFPDGITRFTQRNYNTIREAEKHRQNAIGRGVKDAWIVAYVGDKRYTLEDFIMVDFLGKPVN
jgi:Tol biopolymer transport system component